MHAMIQKGSDYVAPSIMLQFWAWSTGEPVSLRDIACDVAGLVDGVDFPMARRNIIRAERMSHRQTVPGAECRGD